MVYDPKIKRIIAIIFMPTRNSLLAFKNDNIFKIISYQ